MIKCLVDLAKFDAACQVFQGMTDTRKQHYLSRYLWYSLALRRGDDNTGMKPYEKSLGVADYAVQSALNALATIHDDRNRLLFAAVSEAMTYGNKKHGAQLLQRILDKYNNNPSLEVDTPTLLRSTTRLLLSAIVEEQSEPDELLSRLCEIFKSATVFSQKRTIGREPTPLLTLQECKWFEKTSYNAALEHIKTWPAKYVIDLLHYSCQVGLQIAFSYMF